MRPFLLRTIPSHKYTCTTHYYSVGKTCGLILYIFDGFMKAWMNLGRYRLRTGAWSLDLVVCTVKYFGLS